MADEGSVAAGKKDPLAKSRCWRISVGKEVMAKSRWQRAIGKEPLAKSRWQRPVGSTRTRT